MSTPTASPMPSSPQYSFTCRDGTLVITEHSVSVLSRLPAAQGSIPRSTITHVSVETGMLRATLVIQSSAGVILRARNMWLREARTAAGLLGYPQQADQAPRQALLGHALSPQAHAGPADERQTTQAASAAPSSAAGFVVADDDSAPVTSSASHPLPQSALTAFTSLPSPPSVSLSSAATGVLQPVWSRWRTRLRGWWGRGWAYKLGMLTATLFLCSCVCCSSSLLFTLTPYGQQLIREANATDTAQAAAAAQRSATATAYALSHPQPTATNVSARTASPTASPQPTPTPSLAQLTVYVESGDNSVYALRASDGSELWSFETDGSAGSPAVANGVVYVGALDGTAGDLDALDARSGSQLWSIQLPGAIGFNGGAPAIVNGTVYVGTADGYSSLDGYVYALDAHTGSVRWRFHVDSFVTGGPTLADGIAYVGCEDDYLYALNAGSGQLVWKRQLLGQVNSTPTVVNGVVYIGSNEGDSGPGGYLYAVRASDSAVLWQEATDADVDSTPAVANGVIYVNANYLKLDAFRARDGHLLWSRSLGGGPISGTYSSSPCIVGGTVFVGSYYFTVYALSAQSGNVLWTYATQLSVSSSPAVADGLVFIGSDDYNLYALNAANGSVEWHYETGGAIDASPAIGS